MASPGAELAKLRSDAEEARLVHERAAAARQRADAVLRAAEERELDRLERDLASAAKAKADAAATYDAAVVAAKSTGDKLDEATRAAIEATNNVATIEKEARRVATAATRELSSFDQETEVQVNKRAQERRELELRMAIERAWAAGKAPPSGVRGRAEPG
mmetsp:Transcript_6020/g.18983  ORF Transcript_6020/g.18983 Transcript_6020/m.18983 type:complete len:160 (-) Transcript_6020:31-510(-)